MMHNKTSSEILDVIPFVMRKIRKEMRGLAQPELTILQFRVLSRLFCGPKTNQFLADWIGISKATMSRAVSSMVKRGLIVKHPTKDDKRETLLVLTSKGTRKYEKIKEGVRREISKKLKKISRDKQLKVIKGLSILKEIFKNEA